MSTHPIPAAGLDGGVARWDAGISVDWGDIMTPEQIAEILPGLTLHEEGDGASVVSARPDDSGEQVILEISDGGIRHDWEVGVARLTDRAGGSADGTRIRAALITLYAEDPESGQDTSDRSRRGRADHVTHSAGRDVVTGDEFARPGRPDAFYQGGRGEGSVSPGPGDPKLDL
jgi:hypothetical protein